MDEQLLDGGKQLDKVLDQIEKDLHEEDELNKIEEDSKEHDSSSLVTEESLNSSKS